MSGHEKQQPALSMFSEVQDEQSNVFFERRLAVNGILRRRVRCSASSTGSELYAGRHDAEILVAARRGHSGTDAGCRTLCFRIGAELN
jgi:hypothetical protein